MCRWIATLLASLGVLSAGVNRAEARTFPEIKRSGKLIAATEGQFPPFNYFKNGVISGFEVDVAVLLAKKLGLTLEWKTLAFDSLLIGLGQDRYDFAIASHGITPERAKAVLFTKPHYCTGGVVVSSNKLIEKSALKQKVVAVQVGTSYVTAVQKERLYKELKTMPKDTDALQALLAGRVDAWVSDRFVALEAAGKHPLLKVGEPIFAEQVAIAVALSNHTLADALNGALSEIQKDGSYSKLSAQYFNLDVSCR